VRATAGGATGAGHAVLATILRELTVVREEGALTGLYFPRHWPRPDRAVFGPRMDEGFGDVERQLNEYLAGDRSAFELPLKVRGKVGHRATASMPRGRVARLA
jgi:methylated-DNA-[protein]-cysteine S-methyltransferase